MMVSVVMMMMLMMRTAQWIKTNGSSAALIDFKADRWEAQLGCGWHALHDDHDQIIFMTSSWSLWIMYNLDYTDICCVWVECRCFPNKIKMLGSFSDVIILYCVCSYWKLISSTIQERRIRAEDLEKVLGKMLSLQVGESISDITYYNIPGRKAWRKNRKGCGIYKIFRLPWS